MDTTTALQAVAALPGVGVATYGVAMHAAATLHRRDGFATGGQVAKSLSERAARRSAKHTRPTLRRPHAHPAVAFGRYLGRTVRPTGGRQVFARWEDVVAIIAPPRAGKTAYLGHAVIDAPGAALVTSTKLDIYRHTETRRSARGPVWVLNPEGMGDLASTFRWSPIPGCTDPETAIATAAYMVGGAGGTAGVSDGDFWENQNARVLRSFLYAAAVAGKTMRDLARWITNPHDHTALDILEASPATPPGWADALHQITTTSAEKTRDSVFITLSTVVEFLADPAVAECAMPTEQHPGFDIAEFLTGRGTLYLLGSVRERGGMGPLFAALTGRIFDAAKRLSQAVPGERLDPPLSLVLDEACNICPVPLARWCSDAGGRGIALTYAIQSPSQLEERWGKNNAETIWQASNAKLILGGLSVDTDLKALSEVLGHRDEQTPRPAHPKAHKDAPTIRRVPVMEPAEIRQLADGHGLLIYRNLRPVEVVIQPVWDRRDVRRDQRQARKTPTPAPAAPHPPVAQVVELHNTARNPRTTAAPAPPWTRPGGTP